MVEGREILKERRPHFFEGFDPSSSSQRLKIPTKFNKYMEGKTSGTVSLAGPSGNTWNADLIQENGGLFISEGWVTFVKDHCLERGDSLVVRYDGNLKFTVLVFDESSCEKEVASTAECHDGSSNFDKHIGKRRERECADLLDSIIESVPKKMRSSQVHSECIQEVVASMSERCEAVCLSSEREYCGSQSKNAVTIAVFSQSKEATVNNRTSKEDEVGSYATDCMLSASEAERIAQSFTSFFPYFSKVMKGFNISGSYTLNLPYKFSMEHLPSCKVKIVLRNMKGASWTVNSIPTTRVQTSHTFCGGWLGFVRDNYIDLGDICIFELVDKCEFRVQILRVREESLDCQSGKSGYNGLINSAASSHKVPGQLPKKMRGNLSITHLQQIAKVELFYEKGSDHEELILAERSLEIASFNDNGKLGSMLRSSALCLQSKTCNGKKDVTAWCTYGFESWGILHFLNSFELFNCKLETVSRRKSRLQGKQSFDAKGCMSMKSAPEEKLAAQSFISSLPHFVRVMKKFNISGSYTLKVPFQFSMVHLPNCRTEVTLRNLRGECWTVNSIPTTRVQTLHTFCGGWMAFVRDNDIQMGDICIFELVGNCELRVHISGVGKGGQDYQSGRTAFSKLLGLVDKQLSAADSGEEISV
ncbi:hypothetical protein RJ640_020338 [Escallonia rubra]|uniref:TF-B3 domain-containing protein n=1 Tax=Escallonia rubra TaxID=112253 RepID=A0AA88QU81_9ASTE|nr:hypothetical protein RJ640_020338 [Escallonia rubra]